LKPLLGTEGPSVLEWEQQFRDAILAVGQQLFGPMLQKRIDQIDSEFQSKPDQRLIGRRSLEVSTLFGEVRVERDYYLGPKGGHRPADAGLGLEGSATPRPWPAS
jgi:hypothetical protein